MPISPCLYHINANNSMSFLYVCRPNLCVSLCVCICNDCTGVGTGGARPPTRKKEGPAPYLAPLPLFMVHLSLPCPQYINLSAAIP